MVAFLRFLVKIKIYWMDDMNRIKFMFKEKDLKELSYKYFNDNIWRETGGGDNYS